MIRELPIIASNAVKDMLDEWVLTLCIVLSVAAIACPLLILFGLKQGVIQSVRDQFINDPVYRQITPKETVEYQPEFFTDLEADERVKVVIPNITRGASVAQIILADDTKTRNVDVHSSVEDDPLLLMNDAVVPGPGEVVVTASLAERYDISVGDPLEISIGRRYNNKRQTANEKSTVVSILNARGNQSHGVYVSGDLTVDIENFRFGRHVERAGWPKGDLPLTREIYDTVVVGCEADIDSQVVAKATIRTEFKEANRLGVGGLQQYWPFALENNFVWYEFKAIGGPTTARNIKLLRSELRGRGCKHYLQWVEPRIGVSQSGAESKFLGLSINDSAKGIFPVSFSLKAGRPFKDLSIAFMAAGSDVADDGAGVFAFSTKTSNVSINVEDIKASDILDDGTVVVPVEFLSRLRSGDEFEIEMDESSGEVIIGDLGYSGFRVYANSIDDVPVLAADISKLGGVEVLAKTDDIVRAKLLDEGLTKIVFIVALVGLVGGAGALIASLVASVERKKAEMGTYRLIGFNRNSVALFPVVQGVLISLSAVFIAGLFYYIFSGVVDQALGSGVAVSSESTSIVQIHLVQYLIFTVGMVLIAMLCAMIAARRSMKIDPAEALRQE